MTSFLKNEALDINVAVCGNVDICTLHRSLQSNDGYAARTTRKRQEHVGGEASECLVALPMRLLINVNDGLLLNRRITIFSPGLRTREDSG